MCARKHSLPLRKQTRVLRQSAHMLSVEPLLPNYSHFPPIIGKNSASACRLLGAAGWPSLMDDGGQGLFAPPDVEKRQCWWRKGTINWKPNTLQPCGISFRYAERAKCPAFMGEYQIGQMTWSPLRWRWSLLVQRGAWRRIQEEQLGGSLRNRPAVYAQLCWELSFF